MTGLTDEQRAIVSLPPADRALVIAGPGTGKTHTLIARCLRLGETTDDRVLVLSFTRAVVAEIRRRAGEAGGARISAATIDGYAARVVLAAGGELAGDFDRTVCRASALLQDTPALAPRPDHVLVDEVQDLVEPRLTFVLLVLEHSTSGFTAFGDPHQAIYEFEGDGVGPNGVDVLRALPHVSEHHLTRTHRQKVEQLLSGDTSRGGSDVMTDARPLTSIGQLKVLLNTGKAVLLTRTNGEALAMAGLLGDAGVTATLRQGAHARAAPDWIARFAMAAPRDRWTRKRATKTLEGIPDAPPPDEAWRILRRVAAVDADVSLERIRLAASRPASYDDFSPAGGGLISTIHRAKGLEWDQVVVLQPPPSEGLSEEEERVLFVAATRARRELWQFSRPDFGGRLTRGAGRRWELRSWRGRPLALEVRLGDIDSTRPFFSAERNAGELQSALLGLRPGTPALLRRSENHYVIEIEGCETAATTPGFLEDVKRRWPRIPSALRGARVLRTRTVAGDPAITERLGLPDTGLWVGLELAGLVRPEDERKRIDG